MRLRKLMVDCSPYCQSPIAEGSKGICVRPAHCKRYPARDSVLPVDTEKGFSEASGEEKPLGLKLVEGKASIWAGETGEHPRERADDTPFEIGCASCRSDMIAGTAGFEYDHG